MKYRERTEAPKMILLTIPAVAAGVNYQANYVVYPKGDVAKQLEDQFVPPLRPISAISVVVLPDGKVISDAAEAAANDLVADLLIRYELTPADVSIQYESNHGYINLLWWQTINRCWLQKRKELEAPKPKRSSRKKGGTT